MAKVWFVWPGQTARTPGGATEILLAEIIERLDLKATDFRGTTLPAFPSPNQALDSVRGPEQVVVEVEQQECAKHPGWKVGFYWPRVSVEEARSKLGL